MFFPVTFNSVPLPIAAFTASREDSRLAKRTIRKMSRWSISSQLPSAGFSAGAIGAGTGFFCCACPTLTTQDNTTDSRNQNEQHRKAITHHERFPEEMSGWEYFIECAATTKVKTSHAIQQSSQHVRGQQSFQVDANRASLLLGNGALTSAAFLSISHNLCIRRLFSGCRVGTLTTPNRCSSSPAQAQASRLNPNLRNSRSRPALRRWRLIARVDIPRKVCLLSKSSTIRILTSLSKLF